MRCARTPALTAAAAAPPELRTVAVATAAGLRNDVATGRASAPAPIRALLPNPSHTARASALVSGLTGWP
ncbi:hypothetical protein GCM10023320_49870 [Pseudonocardia adelaidensis]|uniref:Uncharacterized protein n=1 Tax=Pseudonocardia adelaidensis TaxID=648754 RepID=A0ABP9NPB4_9PSEU